MNVMPPSSTSCPSYLTAPSRVTRSLPEPQPTARARAASSGARHDSRCGTVILGLPPVRKSPPPRGAGVAPRDEGGSLEQGKIHAAAVPRPVQVGQGEVVRRGPVRVVPGVVRV